MRRRSHKPEKPGGQDKRNIADNESSQEKGSVRAEGGKEEEEEKGEGAEEERKAGEKSKGMLEGVAMLGNVEEVYTVPVGQGGEETAGGGGEKTGGRGEESGRIIGLQQLSDQN